MRRIQNSFILNIIVLMTMLVMSTSFVSAQATPTCADIVAGNPNFSTLLSALQITGFDTTLANPIGGPFTVFAPTNDAFADVAPGTLTPSYLAEILQYHLVAGNISSGAVAATSALTTVLGEQIEVSTVEGTTTMIVLNGDATVVAGDVAGSNCTVHVIDSVLFPPPPATIAEVIAELTDTAESALDVAELTSLFADPDSGPYTVFLPSDEAFADLDADVLADLLADPTALSELLQYHVLAGELSSTGISNSATLTTLTGETIEVDVITEGTNTMIVLNDSVVVQVADIQAENGVVYVIDGVLNPIDPSAVSLSQSSVDAGSAAAMAAIVMMVAMMSVATVTVRKS